MGAVSVGRVGLVRLVRQVGKAAGRQPLRRRSRLAARDAGLSVKRAQESLLSARASLDARSCGGICSRRRGARSLRAREGRNRPDVARRVSSQQGHSPSGLSPRVAQPVPSSGPRAHGRGRIHRPARSGYGARSRRGLHFVSTPSERHAGLRIPGTGPGAPRCRSRGSHTRRPIEM